MCIYCRNALICNRKDEGLSQFGSATMFMDNLNQSNDEEEYPEIADKKDGGNTINLFKKRKLILQGIQTRNVSTKEQHKLVFRNTK